MSTRIALWHLSLSIAIAFVVAVSSTPVVAYQAQPAVESPEPSPENPFGQLSCAGVVPSSKGMYKAVLKTEESLQELTKKLAKESAPDSKELAKLYLLVGQLNRWVNFLDHYREPAVVDWRFRAGFYHKFLLDARNRYYSTPPAAKARVSVLKQLDNGAKAREKAYQKVAQLLNSGELKQAENLIEKTQSEILSISGVLHDTDKKPYYDPMHVAVNAVSVPMSKFRNREAAEADQAERDKLDRLVVDIEELLNNANGPEGLREIAGQWKAIHLQRLRVYAFAHTVAAYGASDVDGASSLARGPAANTNMPEDPAAKIKSGIVDFIKRQADRVEGTQAMKLYQELQLSLAALNLRAQDPAWEAELQKALMEFAKKGKFSSDVYNYQLGTNELLRWRERCADEWAAAKTEVAAKSLAQQELGSKDNFVGLYEQNQQSVLPVILKAIPDLVPDIEKRLVGRSIRTSSVFPMDGAEKAGWYTRNDDGFYFNLTQNPIKQTVAPMLRKELMCEDSNPPLTLAAATALLSAEAGVAEQAGGKMTNFVLEGYVTRMTNIPSGQSSLVPYSTLGPEPRGDAKRYLMLRCELEPEWIQHRYFLVNNLR